jgi:hypothetical protein
MGRETGQAENCRIVRKYACDEGTRSGKSTLWAREKTTMLPGGNEHHEAALDIDPDIEAAWIREAERRWQEIREGKVVCIPAEEVFRRIRATLNEKSDQSD